MPDTDLLSSCLRILPLLVLLVPTNCQQCSRVQACGATISRYPTVQAEEGSGASPSDVTPLYDELLTPIAVFDYSAEAEIKNFKLCTCANNVTCDMEDSSKTLRLDDSVTLHFCEEPAAQIPNECKGRRGILRVIGHAHETGWTLASVTNTLAFCTCPAGFRRASTHMWDHAELALNYKCL
ncbi:unnamed protein product, partial [Mesorhabditis spiculigera]